MNEYKLEYKGYSGSIKISLEDEYLFGTILDIPDLVTYEADTVKQLKVEFREAVNDYLVMLVELGRNSSGN